MSALRDRLAAALSAPASMAIVAGDLAEQRGSVAGTTPAAVLIALTDRPVPGLILTQRPAGMRLHGGQVALPGGRIDPGEDAIAAALREAWEEITLPIDQVQLIGATDPYTTVTGYHVTPVVGVVPPDLPLVANPAEVADWFEAPIDVLSDPAQWQVKQVHYQGRMRSYVQIDWNGYAIWGATAAIIVNFALRLGPWR